MKISKKVLAISFVLMFVLIGIICFVFYMIDVNNSKYHTDKLDGVRFSQTDWGMNLEDTVSVLKSEYDDFGYTYISGVMGGYQTKDNIKVNGLDAKVEFYFAGNSQYVMPYLTTDAKDDSLGLYKVVLYLNEKDDETVYKAFDKELGNNKVEVKKDDKVIGYKSDKVKYTDIKDKKIYDEFSKIIKDSKYEEDKENLYLNSFSIEKLENDKNGYTHKVTYDGSGLAVLNARQKSKLQLFGRR